MYLTNKVTIEWLASNNMLHGNKIGVPVNPENSIDGLHWKTLDQMIEPEDFDKIDVYYDIATKGKI